MTPGRDAREPGYTGNENDPGHAHHPYVRRLASGPSDESQWEVIGRERGDTEGDAMNRLLWCGH